MSNEKEKMSDLAALEMTEKRLEELERRVYGSGSGDSANTRKDEFSTPLVPKLAGKVLLHKYNLHLLGIYHFDLPEFNFAL